MTIVEWGAIIAALVAIGGVIVRLMDRLNKVEAKAESAEAQAKAASHATERRADQLERELVEHRVASAQQFVSRGTLDSMESKITGAINSLTERLDKFFTMQKESR